MKPIKIMEQLYQPEFIPTDETGNHLKVIQGYEQIKNDEDLKDYFVNRMRLEKSNLPVIAKYDENIVIYNGDIYTFDRKFGSFTKSKQGRR